MQSNKADIYLSFQLLKCFYHNEAQYWTDEKYNIYLVPRSVLLHEQMLNRMF